jgi:hypothetical protein
VPEGETFWLEKFFGFILERAIKDKTCTKEYPSLCAFPTSHKMMQLFFLYIQGKESAKSIVSAKSWHECCEGNKLVTKCDGSLLFLLHA